MSETFVRTAREGLLIGSRVRPLGSVVGVGKIHAESMVARGHAVPHNGPESEPDVPETPASNPSKRERADLKAKLAAAGAKVENANKGR